MTHDASPGIEAWFAAHVGDWTPLPAREEARVLFMPVSSDADITRRCAAILSPAELRKADSFLTEELRAHFKQQRAFRRYCGARALGSIEPLSHIAFAEGDKGRPYLPQAPEISFSFSSCRLGFLGAWSSTRDVGVDIEDQTRSLDLAEMAHGYFSDAEAQLVAQARAPSTFFALWTLKEAALKSIGEGLPFGLDAFAFELEPRLAMVRAPHDCGGVGRFEARLVRGADHCAALVTAQRT